MNMLLYRNFAIINRKIDATKSEQIIFEPNSREGVNIDETKMIINHEQLDFLYEWIKKIEDVEKIHESLGDNFVEEYEYLQMICPDFFKKDINFLKKVFGSKFIIKDTTPIGHNLHRKVKEINKEPIPQISDEQTDKYLSGEFKEEAYELTLMRRKLSSGYEDLKKKVDNG